jgi:hypothetical protein
VVRVVRTVVRGGSGTGARGVAVDRGRVVARLVGARVDVAGEG